MAKVLILYYSMYGHIETMANAVAEGARSVAGTEVTIKRVPELMSEEAARKAGAKLDQVAPIATVDELPGYDAIIFGTPTRFGNMCAQMRNFLDQTGGLWLKGNSDRQGGQCVHVHSHAAWRAGNHDHLVSFHVAAPRHDPRGGSLFLPGDHEHERDHRRIAVWREHAGRRRRQPSTVRKRIEGRPFPGKPCGASGQEAICLTREEQR